MGQGLVYFFISIILIKEAGFMLSFITWVFEEKEERAEEASGEATDIMHGFVVCDHLMPWRTLLTL